MPPEQRRQKGTDSRRNAPTGGAPDRAPPEAQACTSGQVFVASEIPAAGSVKNKPDGLFFTHR